MPLVRPRRGHDADLSSGPFPILAAIGLLEGVVFPHGLYAQQLGAGPGRRDELVGRVPPDPVDAIDQKPVGFLPMARYRESGKTAASSHIGTIIDDANVELQKPIEAASV